MSTRLLLKLAGPVPSLKKCATPVRRLLKTARYLLKTHTYRHAMAYNTEKDSSTVKDPTIDILDEPHKHRNHVTVITQSIRASSQILLLRIFLPPFWKRFVKVFNRKKFATYSSCNFT